MRVTPESQVPDQSKRRKRLSEILHAFPFNQPVIYKRYEQFKPAYAIKVSFSCLQIVKINDKYLTHNVSLIKIPVYRRQK